MNSGKKIILYEGDLRTRLSFSFSFIPDEIIICEQNLKNSCSEY